MRHALPEKRAISLTITADSISTFIDLDCDITGIDVASITY